MEIPESLAVIDFPEGHRYAGLEVRMSLDITLDDAVQVSRVDPSEPETAFKKMGELLRGWNVTRKGVAVPCTAAGLQAVGLPFVLAVLRGYNRAVAEVMNVGDPFDEQSSSTVT